MLHKASELVGSCGHGTEISWLAEWLLASQEGLCSMRQCSDHDHLLILIAWRISTTKLPVSAGPLVLQILTYLLTYLLTHSLTHSMMQVIWKADSHSACQKISWFLLYGTRRFIAVLTKARHLTLSWASRIQFAPSVPISLRSILMLSSHLRLGLPSGLLPSDLPTKTL
jgi:hypothetical protein